MSQLLRQRGVVDENGTPIPSGLRRLASVAEGQSPDGLRQMLRCIGYEPVSPTRTHTDANGRRWNNDSGGSEIWRYRDPNSDSNHYVRIDEHGHEDAARQGYRGGGSHYHVEEVQGRDQSASPVLQRFRQDEADRGTRMDSDYVPQNDRGQPLTREQNYEQRPETSATSYDRDGNPSRDPAAIHHMFP